MTTVHVHRQHSLPESATPNPSIERTSSGRLRHAAVGMKIFPLLVEPCPWEQVAWLAKLQLRPQDAKRRARALATFQGAARTQKLADVATEIAGIVKQ
jgi:hypothetical protein